MTRPKSSPWHKITQIVGIVLGYLGVIVLGLAMLFEFINITTIVGALILIVAGVLVANGFKILETIKG